jgi:uncharacterized protein YndB with AHSA1/START domain
MTDTIEQARGKLEQVGEQWRLRFTRELAHAPEQVWRAITEREHLQAWFPHTIVGDWVVGGELRFESEYGDFGGEVLAYEPPELLEFRWGPDTIRLELAAAADGGCTLTLLDTIEELGKAARDGAGWHACLDRLEAELDGGRAGEELRERWREVHPGYVDAFGPDAATIGPPEQLSAESGSDAG